MAWSIESSRGIRVTAASIWRRYADPGTWPEWAHNTESVTFAGELAVGVEGRIKPLSGPAQAVHIVEFEPERSLSSEMRLPGAAMTFHYLIEPTGDGVRVRHLIRMSGPLSWLYGLLLKGRNARQLADETERLAALVLR